MALTKVNSILVDGAINTDASGNVGIGTSSPAGKPYKIVDVADIPTDRSFRGAWIWSDE